MQRSAPDQPPPSQQRGPAIQEQRQQPRAVQPGQKRPRSKEEQDKEDERERQEKERGRGRNY
jgi:hypothetical protein